MKWWLWRLAALLFVLSWLVWIWKLTYQATVKNPETWVNVHIQSK